MAITPYPTDFVYAGAAQKLTLSSTIIDGGGDLTISVAEDASANGWPASLATGQRMVISVGRGTPYETKYAIKAINAGAGGSTLTVDSADKTWDSTPVTSAPIGTVVEHALSAAEMDYLNSHTRSKNAHGSDGELVDQNSSQALSNKTFQPPSAAGHPATKEYIESLPYQTRAGVWSGDTDGNGLVVIPMAFLSSGNWSIDGNIFNLQGYSAVLTAKEADSVRFTIYPFYANSAVTIHWRATSY